MSMSFPLLIAVLLPAATSQQELFTTRVRPILAAHCFKCHGPDEKARKAKLRLDLRESALRVLSPGKGGESELVRRTSSSDEAVMMPPPHAKVPLSEAEKATLRQWVE